MLVAKVNANELARALNRLKSALSTHDMRPILTHFLLDEDRIRADNEETSVLAPFPIQLKVAVPGGVLSQLVDSLKDHWLDLELNEDEAVRVLEIRAAPMDAKQVGKLKGRIRIQDHGDFPAPRFASGDPTPLDEATGKALYEALEWCMTSALRGSGTVYNGVAITPQGVFSSDNDRVSWHRGFVAPVGQIIPYGSIQQFLRLGAVPVEMGHDNYTLELGYKDGSSLLSRLSGIQFPVDKVVHQFEGFEGDGYELPAEIIPALNRADVVQADTPEIDRLVFVKMDGREIRLTSVGSAGDLSEVFEISDNPIVGEFRVVPKFLRAILTKGMRMYYAGERGHLLFRSGEFQHLISLPVGS
jgi:hypothetical protein